MKNFLIAIVLAVILVNCLGGVIDDWFGMHIVMSDELLSPWENLAALSVIGVLLAGITCCRYWRVLANRCFSYTYLCI